jgi:hypothetical protein
MDCSLDERRIAKLLDWQFERLAVLQKLRRQQLIARLIDSAEREDALAPAEVEAPACPPTSQQGEPQQGAALQQGDLPQRTASAATDSRDGGNWKNCERTGPASALPVPFTEVPRMPTGTA